MRHQFISFLLIHNSWRLKRNMTN